MPEELEREIELLTIENEKLQSEVRRLKEWVEILTKTKQKLQQKIFILEGSIKKFGQAIGEDV